MFPLQSKRKSDFKKGKSQSFGDDLVWISLVHASPFALVLCCLYHPAGVDTVMGDVSGVAALDLDSRLSTFLARFDLMEFNNLPTSHFYSFGSSYGSFLCFSIPVEGLSLLESLLKSHGDFTSGFRGGVFLSNILMELLCAVLVSLRDSSMDSLFEQKLLEWRRVVQDLLEAKFNLSFLLDHLRLLARVLFQK